MLHRFQNGTIVDLQAGEDLRNNDLYILDPETREIRKPRSCDEWLTCQLIYVYETDSSRFSISEYGKRFEEGVIKKGQICRCWIGYLVI